MRCERRNVIEQEFQWIFFTLLFYSANVQYLLASSEKLLWSFYIWFQDHEILKKNQIILRMTEYQILWLQVCLLVWLSQRST